MRGVGRLRRWGARLGLLPPAIILAYHRVADLAADPQLLAVSPRHFAEHLEVLRRAYRPLPLRALRQRLRGNRWRSRTLVLTFDDGYADNLRQARPLLAAAGIPATVFVTAGMVDGPHEFWWDALERVLLRTPDLPMALSLVIAGARCAWSLPAEQAARPSPPDWHVLRVEPALSGRESLYLELAGRLRGLDPMEREALVDQLFDWAGQPRTAPESQRALTTAELHALARDGLVEVGAHTLTHPVLSARPLEAQREEIAASKRRLETALGAPVTSFAYPFGGRGDYQPATAGLVQAAGFHCACSNFQGHVHLDTDPYQLPRYLVRDWDGDTFARHLETWFAG